MADNNYFGGWLNQPEQVEAVLATMPYPKFFGAAANLVGDGRGKTTLLYKALKEANGGQYPTYVPQAIGDCVSFGFAHGVDLLAAVEIVLGKENEELKVTATEPIYGMSRVDIGGQRGSYSDGSVGAWAAKAVSTLGTVSREVVGPYDGNRAKDWGAKGCPAEIDTKALDHRVRTASLVNTYEELEDALANGYPVPVCSSQGFTMRRDAQGFCKASGRWDHCMLIMAVRAGDRPGACILNNWPLSLYSGPLDLDQPDGSFWADRDTVARMLAARDSFTLSGFDGYPGQKLPERWSYDGFA